MRILITGTTGNSMPPPYAGIPKLVLITAREWKKAGHEVGITFTYRSGHPDDLTAGAEYFFEYGARPDKMRKMAFLLKYFFRNPVLYVHLLRAYRRICPRFSREIALYASYGVYLDTVAARFKPDIMLGEAALIKSFMAAEVAALRGIPIVFDVYAEVRDLSMGENRHLNENQRKTYWTSFLNKAALVVGLDNCSVEMRAYLPPGRLVEFWDTCDYRFYSTVPRESRAELRDHFGLPRDMFLVAAVGSFELRKGHDHLIRAVAELAREGKNVGMVICGSLGSKAKWEEIAAAEDVENRAFFFSSISEAELVRLHHAVDLYTNLSNTQRSCSLDLALLEAMAAGLPVVVYNTGALAKAVPRGTNGCVVPTNSIPGVCDAIRAVYAKSAAERESMGRESAAIAEKVDIGVTAALKLRWLEDVVAGRPVVFDERPPGAL